VRLAAAAEWLDRHAGYRLRKARLQ